MTSLVLKGHEGFMRVNFTPNIGDEEMKYLCKCLRWNNTITHLDLSSNNISDEGAKELAAVLRENRQSRLRRINLKQNFIRSGGLAALAESLSTNKNIEVLELGNQFVINTVSKAVTLSSDRYEKLLVSLIEDTLDRKREILSDCNYFHRYLQPLEAEEKVRKQNAVGSFLFYIKQSAPGIIFVCYSTLDDRKQVQYVHKVSKVQYFVVLPFQDPFFFDRKTASGTLRLNSNTKHTIVLYSDLVLIERYFCLVGNFQDELRLQFHQARQYD